MEATSSLTMDQKFEAFEEKMKKLENNQEDILSRMDKLEKQFADLEFQTLKGMMLIEVEQELELQRINKTFDNVERTCESLQTANEDMLEIMLKLKATTEAQVIKRYNNKARLNFVVLKLVQLKKFLLEQMKSMMEDLKTELTVFKDCVGEMQMTDTKTKPVVARKITSRKIKYYEAKPITLQRKVLNLKPDLVWKISDIQRMMTQSVEKSLKSFTVTGYPFWALSRFFSDGDNLSLIFYFDPEKIISPEMQPKVVPRIHLLLKDQSGNKETQDLIRSGCCCFGLSSKFMPFVFSRSIILNPSYIADDALTVEIHVEQPHVANRVHSRNGTLTFTIFSYRKCKELEKKELMLYQLSPYFYTSPRGYRVQAAVYLNGGGTNKGQGISVDILFQKGEFDQELSPHFPHTTTLTIFNPLDPLHFITGNVSNDIRENNASYLVNLWGHDVIEKLVVEDSFILEVVISPK